MFKRRCHRKGEAIRVENKITYFCKCISYEETWALWQDGYQSGLKEVTNV